MLSILKVEFIYFRAQSSGRMKNLWKCSTLVVQEISNFDILFAFQFAYFKSEIRIFEPKRLSKRGDFMVIL